MFKRIVLIIGLPGSGKTHYSTNLNNYEIFDDFITHFYNGKAINSIISGKNVCLNDPRLCNFKTFNKFIEKILEYAKISEISVLLFENNKEQCLVNIKKRNNIKLYQNSINRYSQYYNLTNYTKYDPIILPIYKQNS